PLQFEPQAGEPRHQRFRLARHLRLTHDPTSSVHHTHARGFQRYVNAGIVLHGRLSLMLGAGPNPRLRNTITARDDRPSQLAPAHYPISAVETSALNPPKRDVRAEGALKCAPWPSSHPAPGS